MLILHVFIYIFIVLFCILTALLFIPFGYSFRASRYEEDTVLLGKASWLFGFIQFFYEQQIFNKTTMTVKIGFIRIPIKNKPEYKLKKAKNKKSNDKKQKKQSSSLEYLDIEFIKQCIHALKKVLFHIKPKQFYVKGSIGFEDPFYTGLLCSVVNIFRETFYGMDISIEPIFDDEILEGKCLIQGRMVLVVAAGTALKLYFARPVRNKSKKQTKIKEANTHGY